MMQRIFLVAVFFVTGVCGLASADTVEYIISIDMQADRTNLDVTMSFAGDISGNTLIELPRDRYGTPELWNSVVELDAQGARIFELEDAPYSRRLSHQPGAAITLSYTVSRSELMDEDFAYSPSVSNSHFHFFGSQWRVTLPERQKVQQYRVRFANVPDGWEVFSNFGDGPGPYEVEAVDSELSAFIGGGEYQSARFDIRQIPVGVYVLKSFDEPERIVKAIEEIFELQGEMFGGFNRDFFLISMTARNDIQAGTAIDNAFVCFADLQTKRTNLDLLIAHEAFHNWLPHSGTIDCWESGTESDEFRLDWFVEGFTEYVARKILLDSGRISKEEFVQFFNRDLREQAQNPAQRASLMVVEKARKEKRFTNFHERTSYFRGPLIALLWEQQLEKKGETTVVGIVQEFVRRAADAGGTLSESQFFQLFEEFGVDIRSAYQKHIVFGDPPEIPNDIFGPEYVAVERTYRRFEQSFDVLASRSSKIIEGVELDGPAYRAGLRDGMELIQLELSNSEEKVTRVTVFARPLENQQKQVIRFHPKPIDVSSRQFHAVER